MTANTSIHVFAAEKGTETAHFFIEASDEDDARAKLGTQFPGFEDADCLGVPADVMDLHPPDVVMV